MSVQAAQPPVAGRRRVTLHRQDVDTLSGRQAAAVAVGAVGLVLVGVSAGMPWLTLFHGYTPLRGFRLDGGDLSGMALAAALLLVVAARHGGGLLIRPVSALLAVAVVAGALRSWRGIAAYVADPGPAAALTAPTGGPGPLVMALGGVALLVAVFLVRLPSRPLAAPTRLPLALAALAFVAAWMHLVLTPEHFGESAILGAGFLLSAVVQLVLAALAVERPSERVWSLLVMVNTALIVVWAYAVLHGLPVGGNEHGADGGGLVIGSGEPIELAAAVTKLAELGGIAVALVLMRRASRATDRDPPAGAAAAYRPGARGS